MIEKIINEFRSNRIRKDELFILLCRRICKGEAIPDQLLHESEYVEFLNWLKTTLVVGDNFFVAEVGWLFTDQQATKLVAWYNRAVSRVD